MPTLPIMSRKGRICFTPTDSSGSHINHTERHSPMTCPSNRRISPISSSLINTPTIERKEEEQTIFNSVTDPQVSTILGHNVQPKITSEEMREFFQRFKVEPQEPMVTKEKMREFFQRFRAESQAKRTKEEILAFFRTVNQGQTASMRTQQ